MAAGKAWRGWRAESSRPTEGINRGRDARKDLVGAGHWPARADWKWTKMLFKE